MKHQIRRMLEALEDPRRICRSAGVDLPWMSPVFAVAFALGKLSRILTFNHRGIRLSDKAEERTMAEELREAASYLLRAASLLDPDDDGREVTHEGYPTSPRAEAGPGSRSWNTPAD